MELDDKVQKKFNQLRALKGNQSRSDSELLVEAQNSVDSKDKTDEVDIESYFIDKTEKKVGLELLKKYLADYVIETVSDRSSLAQLIFLEVLNQRLQRALNEAQQDSNGLIPNDLVELIHKNIKEITTLKSTLGIAKGKKEDSRDGFSYIQLMQKKYKVWQQENQGTRSVWCPQCGKAVMWKIRMEAWEAQKHPFFKDRILGNEKLIELYKNNKITKDDLAAIFEVSPFYVDWLIEKGWGLKLDANKEKPQEEPPKPESPTV